MAHLPQLVGSGFDVGLGWVHEAEAPFPAPPHPTTVPSTAKSGTAPGCSWGNGAFLPCEPPLQACRHQSWWVLGQVCAAKGLLSTLPLALHSYSSHRSKKWCSPKLGKWSLSVMWTLPSPHQDPFLQAGRWDLLLHTPPSCTWRRQS